MKTLLECSDCGHKRIKESLGSFDFAQNAGDTCRQYGCFGKIMSSKITDKEAEELEKNQE